MQNVPLVHESPSKKSLLPPAIGEAVSPTRAICGPVLAVAATAGIASSAVATAGLTSMRRRHRSIFGPSFTFAPAIFWLDWQPNIAPVLKQEGFTDIAQRGKCCR